MASGLLFHFVFISEAFLQVLMRGEGGEREGRGRGEGGKRTEEYTYFLSQMHEGVLLVVAKSSHPCMVLLCFEDSISPAFAIYMMQLRNKRYGEG